jgi:RHS repeat-associated protein
MKIFANPIVRLVLLIGAMLVSQRGNAQIGGETMICGFSSVNVYRYYLLNQDCNATWEIEGADVVSQTSKEIRIIPTSSFVNVIAYYSCPSSNLTSATLVVSVYPMVTATVSLSGPSSVAYGSTATFTATGSNNGSGIANTYVFTVNGSVKQSGASTTFSTTTLLNGDVVQVTATPSTTCRLSASASKTVTVTNMPVVTPPKIPLVTENTCGTRTMTRQETPTATMGYYWQSTDTELSTSQSGASLPVTTSGKYYIRARNLTTLVWSAPTVIQVDIDPVDVVFTSYNIIDARATNSIVLKPGVSIISGNTFSAKIQITNGCNDIYNWSEELGFDENGKVVINSRSYYNGLGNTLQTQTKTVSNSKVLVSQPLYDSYYGAAAVTMAAPIVERDFIYKPKFVTNTNNAAYGASDFDTSTKLNNPTAVGATVPGTLGWYYSSNNTLEPQTPTTNFPYTRTYAPAGPNPLTVTSAAAGNEYRMGSGHEVKVEKSKIETSDLQHYSALRTHFTPGATATIVGYKSVTTDANAKKSVAFTDASGKTLATAVLVGTTYTNWSYAYYNDGGQLVGSVAPEGVVIGVTTYPQYVTLYKYDQLGRLIEMTTPDEGVSRYVYSTDGKVRFSENALQRTQNKFSYVNYDKLGRVIESGEYSSTGSGFYIFQPHTTASPASNSVLNLVDNIGYVGVSRKVSAEQARCFDYTFVEYDKQASDFPDAATASQENLTLAVSRTENANAITWYSYNEFEQVAKVWQKIFALDNAIKTISYTYDYFGNAIQVAYQQGNVNEDFYHYYEYDADQRLSKVYTSTDGSSKTLQAHYKYYIHGPLKRVELATDLQGVDYVYNLDGSLKLINHPDPAKDPGGDGIVGGANASVQADIFGEALDYHAGDYVGAQYNAGNVTVASTYPDQFSGPVKSIRWHSPTDSHTPRAYAFTYDDTYQMKNADWGNVTGSSGTYSFSKSAASAYQESVTNYDKNGNIRALLRKGQTGNNVANFQYNYTASTNKLSGIVDAGTSTSVMGYQYNALGEMTQQVEGSKTLNLVYGAHGLVKEIRNAANALVLAYDYDDQGNRIRKVLYNTEGANTVARETFYIYDPKGSLLAIYEKLPSAAATLKEVLVYGQDRLAVYKPEVAVTFFEVSDHLGNVRGVLGNPETLTFTATMEDNGQTAITNPRVQEMASFENISTTAVSDNRMNKTTATSASPVPRYSSYLKWISNMQGSDAAQKSVGPSISLKVEPGDKVDIQTWAKFKKKHSYSRNSIASAMASILGGGFVGTAAGIDVLASSTQVFENGLVSAVAASGGGTTSQDRPYAYVYYLLYDRNFTPITQGYSRIPVAAGFDPGSEGLSIHQKMSIPTVNITTPGYMYVFVANESENTEVWFDDLQVMYDRSTVVAGSDYYPFGLVMESREITQEDYRYGYQGQYSEKDATTGWNSFTSRMYDPRIGRWTTSDPGGQYPSPYMAMGNTPNMSVDPDGEWSWITSGVGFVAGAAIGYAVSDGDWGWTLAGGVAGGALGGVLFNQGHNGATRFNGGYREYGGLSIEFNSKLFKNFSFSSPAYFNLLILHDPWKPKDGSWGKLDGHVFIDDNGTDYSFRPRGTRNGKPLPQNNLNKNLWHSDGWVGSDPGYAAGTRDAENQPGGYSHSELRVKTTAAKKRALLANIKKAALNPPDYSFIGKRCAGFAMKMMRRSKIVPWTSKFHQFTPRLLENYMSRRPGVTRVFP